MITLISIFISVVLASIVYLIITQFNYEKIQIDKRVKQSLKEIDENYYLSTNDSVSSTVVNKKVKKKAKIYKSLTMAGIKMDHNLFIAMQLLVMVFLFIIGVLRNANPFICIVLPIFWVLLTVMLIKRKTKKRKAKFNTG